MKGVTRSIACGEVGDYQLLTIFLAWIFTEIVPHLIATCFYVTEGEGTGSQVLYYRKEEWEMLRAVGEKQMESHFVRVRFAYPNCCDSYYSITYVAFAGFNRMFLGCQNWTQSRFCSW